MIYTTYFGKLRKLPHNIFPVAICRKPPDWYKGAKYRVLVPSFNLFVSRRMTDLSDESYAECFNSVLRSLSVQDVLTDLHRLVWKKIPLSASQYYIFPERERRRGMAVQPDNICLRNDYHVALVCYEKPEDFCHRHVVAKWLRENGIACTELEYKK